MLSLQERLLGIVKILKDSDERLIKDSRYDGTGYMAFKPELLMQAILNLKSIKEHGISIDLGCGNGGWMLLAVAAGYDSYGIEIHPLLIKETKHNYDLAVEQGFIDKKIMFKLAFGNFYPLFEKDALFAFRELHRENIMSMPWIDVDAYSQLGINIQDVDIFYAWSWPSQSRFLYNFLSRFAKCNAIFILPAYVRYTQGENMNASFHEPNKLILEKLNVTGDIFIGRKVE